MYAGKPIIGIIGGIGSGKSFVAQRFAELGCLVIDSDQQVDQAYRQEDVKRELRNWWADEVFGPGGEVDKKAVARRVFSDAAQRQRLQDLLYPILRRQRDTAMSAAAGDPRVIAFVWDAPMLIEAGLAGECDAIVFVDSPPEQRYQRVRENRGWSHEEWVRREKIQFPLDKKREIAKYVVRNTAGADEVRGQVREVLSRIVSGMQTAR